MFLLPGEAICVISVIRVRKINTVQSKMMCCEVHNLYASLSSYFLYHAEAQRARRVAHGGIWSPTEAWGTLSFFQAALLERAGLGSFRATQRSSQRRLPQGGGHALG